MKRRLQSFAPGVIDGPHRRRIAIVKRVAIAVVLLWFLAFFAGLLRAAWRLL